MRILWLQPYFPWPCTNGGKTRQFNLLKRLHARGHDITLVTLCNGKPPADAVAVIERIVSRLICVERRPLKSLQNLYQALFSGLPLTAVINGFDAKLSDTIETLLAQPWDVIQLEHSYFYQPFLAANRQQCKPFFITEHNIESTMGLSVLGKLPRVLHPLIGVDEWRYLRWERQVMNAATHILAVTEHDRAHFAAHFRSPVSVIDNGVDCARFAGVNSAGSGSTLTFLGNFDYFPNIDAVEWSVKEVLPLVRARRPDVTFKIYGHNSRVMQTRLGTIDGVEWGGFIDDLADLYRQSTVFFSAIRHGGGSKLKILEAMAAGMPIVATPESFSGLALEGEPVAEIHRDAPALASAIIDLLDNPSAAQRLGEQARRWVTRHHDWDAIVDKLEACYALTAPNETARTAAGVHS